MSSSTPESPYLFVYGTLRGATHTKWSQYLSVFVGPGRSAGALFRLNGYCGMVASADDGMWVRGEVYLMNDPASALPVLDAYEGCGPGVPPPHEFERQLVNARLDDGRTVEAWAYVYAFETDGKERIPSGDFLEPMSS